MENQQNQQHDVEEIVAKEGLIYLDWVHPRTVHKPTEDTNLSYMTSHKALYYILLFVHLLYLPERKNNKSCTHK